MTLNCEKCNLEICLPTSPGPLANALAGIERRGAFCRPCMSIKRTTAYYKSSVGKLKRKAHDIKHRVKRVAATRRWRENNRERSRELDQIHRYGRTRKELGNRCAICGTINNICVDHDHRCCPGAKTCGKCVRDVLCVSCNTLIGKLESNPGRLAVVQGYLTMWKASF